MSQHGVLGMVVSHSPKRVFLGAACSQSPAITQPLSPRPASRFHLETEPEEQAQRVDICSGCPVLAGFLGKRCDADTPPSSDPPILHPAQGRVEPQPPQHVQPLDSLVVLSNLRESLKNRMRPHSGSYCCLLQNAKFISLNSSPIPF